VQKIGDSYRVIKKIFTGSGWKSHFGGASLHEIPLTEEHKLWADECAKCFGGMDILAVDALHGKDGKDYIIELNDTAIGILADRWEEDSITLRDLTLDRMDTIYCKHANIQLLAPVVEQVAKAYRGERPDNSSKQQMLRTNIVDHTNNNTPVKIGWQVVVLSIAMLVVGAGAGYIFQHL